MRYLYLTIFLLFLTPLVTFAQVDFVPLVDLPYIDNYAITDTQGTAVGRYINAFYLIAISVAAFLAVVKIIFGGVKYMLSDVVTDKSEAKKDIRGALLGLLIVLAAVLILNTIWSGFTNFAIFQSAIQTEINYENDLDLTCQLFPGRPECRPQSQQDALQQAAQDWGNTLPPDLPVGTSVTVCSAQGGPIRCQNERLACGSAAQQFVQNGQWVIACPSGG